MHIKLLFAFLLFSSVCQGSIIPPQVQHYSAIVIDEYKDLAQDVQETGTEVKNAIKSQTQKIQKQALQISLIMQRYTNEIRAEARGAWEEGTDIAREAKNNVTTYVKSTRLAQSATKTAALVQQKVGYYTKPVKEWIDTVKNIKDIKITFVVDQPKP